MPTNNSNTDNLLNIDFMVCSIGRILTGIWLCFELCYIVQKFGSIDVAITDKYCNDYFEIGK